MDQKQFIDRGQSLKDEMLEYNWKYRYKICTKCTRQKELNCLKVDNYRMIKGKEIQETHCRKLIQARTAKNPKVAHKNAALAKKYAQDALKASNLSKKNAELAIKSSLRARAAARIPLAKKKD